jgi:phosphoglucosamine mutase
LPRRYFGTDGVRGVVGSDLTEDLVERLGRAFALWGSGAPVLVGRDTRASGPELEAALVRGLADSGSDVLLAGVLPTPAVALLAGDGSGAVISASHNPPEYNGVKFFASGGRKLTDDEEQAVEDLLEDAAGKRADRVHTGRATDDPEAAVRYVDLVTSRFGVPLDGVRVAVDCANGAMSEVAPHAFEKLGCHVVLIGNEPDGTNINVGCGATDLSAVRQTALANQVDVGVAFDGDGDRMLAVDAAGNGIDGDQILAIVALHLGVDQVAVTEMTNLGFHELMKERGVRVVTTDVGDRFVAEALRREGGVLGGEQSGHLIYLRGHTTGDGLVAALLLCRALTETGKPLSELASAMPRFPQARTNVPVRSKEIPRELRLAIEELALGGRVVVRPSGTEPVIRVLAEAETEKAAEDLCVRIAALVSRELGS